MANKFFLYKYEEGDIVTMKKAHPCGSKEWLIKRIGADAKLCCQGCGHEVIMPRQTLEKATTNVKRKDQ